MKAKKPVYLAKGTLGNRALYDFCIQDCIEISVLFDIASLRQVSSFLFFFF